jgi:sulfofructose kinase
VNSGALRERPQIVGIGLRCLDVVMTLNDMPDWQNGAWLTDFCFQGGGPVGTALVAAARLGARAGFIGTIGNDDIGALKRKSLTGYGVDISRAIVLNEAENQVAFVYVHEGTGERVFSGNAHIRDFPLRERDLDREYITEAEFLHVDGFYPEASLAAAGWMREAGKTVILDLEKPRSAVGPDIRRLVGFTDVLICGQGGLAALTGTADLEESAHRALQMGPHIVVETLGAGGSCTAIRNDVFCSPAFGVRAVNTTGAGDVFHGAYIVGLLRGWDLRLVAAFASAASAITCTRLGGFDRIPTYDTVRAFLSDRGVEIPPPVRSTPQRRDPSDPGRG